MVNEQIRKNSSRTDGLTIAYIVLCHDEPHLLGRVAKSLRYGNDRLFVHVDKKVTETPFLEAVQGLENVQFVSHREEIYWGGFSSIVATMESIRDVLQSGIIYDRIVLLQGKDYPLHSPAYIHSFFQAHSTEEFCHAINVTTSPNPRDYMKCCGYWRMDGKKSFKDKVINKALAFFNCKLKVKYRKGYFCNSDQRWDVYKGWAQVAITSKCAKYILDIYDQCPAYNKFMRHRFPPDEIYIHTILHNSFFRDNISNYRLVPRKTAEWESTDLNLTYFEYPAYVTVFKDEEELSDLLSTKALFLRKVTYGESASLLEEIDKFILSEMNTL